MTLKDTEDPAYYVRFVEFGTEHSPANPFMRRTWDEQRAAIFNMIVRTLTGACTQEANAVKRK